MTMAGCAASPEVKTASSEIGMALGELRSAQRDFQSAYIRELNEIQQLIASSILSDAVNRKVAELVEKDLDGDLFQLSGSIRNARDAAHKRVNMIVDPCKTCPALPTGPHPDYVKYVDDTLVESVAGSLMRQAKLAEGENPGMAKVLREKADKAATDLRALVSPEERSALAELVRLESIKKSLPTQLRDLDEYVRFLQLVHEQVNEWVLTDVTVKGDELARLIDRNADLIGLGDGL
jgi:hypothetical protein